MDGKLRNMTGLYLRRGAELLLLYRIGSSVVEDSYTPAAGGHFEQEELNDAKACVLRELFEETGLTEGDVTHLSLRYVTLRLKGEELRLNYYFFADLKDGTREIVSNEGKLKWFSLKELAEAELEMPYTAGYVVRHYLEIGCRTDALYVGAASADGVVFTEMKAF